MARNDNIKKCIEMTKCLRSSILRSAMHKRIILWLPVVGVVALSSCTSEQGPLVLDNPVDQSGTNWHPPSVKVMTDTTVAINDSIYIHATGSDSNGTIKKYLWALDGGNYVDSTNIGRIKTAFTSLGVKTVRVIVRDNDGVLSEVGSIKITVHLYPPSVKVMTDTTVAIIDSFYIHATGSDTNGTIKKYLWALDGVNYKDSTDSGRIKTAFTSPGGKRVLVKARDDDGIESPEASISFSVYLYQPHVSAVFWYVWGGVPDTDVAINDSFFIHAVGTDTNGTIKKYLWALDGVTYKDSTDSGSIKTVFTSVGINTVRVKVRDNYGQVSTADSVHVTALIPGVITIITQPRSQSVAIGQSVTFSVTAIGTGTLSYQWYKDNTAISGMTSSSFPLLNIQVANAGTYTVTVSNGTLPNATSNGAVLTVIPNTITDIDGNVYHTVLIGTQVWLKENLKTTKYNDGSPIPLVTNNTWGALTTPGYCWYNNDSATYKNIYGALYNWYAVNTGKLAPTGWHVPTDSEWSALTTYLGGESVAGGKLKETGTTHWASPNTGTTNETGFSALPGGCRSTGSTFNGMSFAGSWWSATVSDATNSWYREMHSDPGYVYRYYDIVSFGFSVRCVRDP